MKLIELFPDSLIPIFMTLALSFLIGLEREEHAQGHSYNFGGVRTFPIIGFCGYMTASLSEGQPWLLAIGFLILGAMMWLSYKKKLEISASAGATSEVSGLFTFLLGAMIFHNALWESTALAIIVLLLLELKSWLESLAKKIPPEEIFTFTRFLLISAVILPIVPNHDYTEFHLNPFYTWLIVVAICSLSYAAYVVEILIGPRRGLLFAAIFGGIYSSTSATIVLSKRSQSESSRLCSGAILIASGFMYLRLIILLGIFNWSLCRPLIIPFLCLGALFFLVGWLWMKSEKDQKSYRVNFTGKNPLELQSALIFAVLFSVMGFLTALTLKYLGSPGVLGLSFVTGLTDVDPYIMSLTKSAGTILTEPVAINAIIIATTSNNLMKAFYAFIFGSPGVRKQGAATLAILAIVSAGVLLSV